MASPLGCGCAVLVAVPVVLGLLSSLAGVVVDDPHAGTVPDEVDGVHPVLLDAYVQGARRLAGLHPECTGMRWQILAGIGSVESDHAAGSRISQNGTPSRPSSVLSRTAPARGTTGLPTTTPTAGVGMATPSSTPRSEPLSTFPRTGRTTGWTATGMGKPIPTTPTTRWPPPPPAPAPPLPDKPISIFISTPAVTQKPSATYCKPKSKERVDVPVANRTTTIFPR